MILELITGVRRKEGKRRRGKKESEDRGKKTGNIEEETQEDN